MPNPFHRTNINLHQSDYEYLLANYGYGWTEVIREWVHAKIKEAHKPEDELFLRTGSVNPSYPPAVDLTNLLKDQTP